MTLISPAPRAVASPASALAKPIHTAQPPTPPALPPTKCCPSPATFPFPYTPYSVQYELMSAIYHTCEAGQHNVAIFESPTGTGKTLSIITACLHWLIDHYPTCPQRKHTASTHTTATLPAPISDVPSWVTEQVEQLQQNKENEVEDTFKQIKQRVTYHNKQHTVKVKSAEVQAELRDYKEELDNAQTYKLLHQTVQSITQHINAQNGEEDHDLVVNYSEAEDADSKPVPTSIDYSTATAHDKAAYMQKLMADLRSTYNPSTNDTPVADSASDLPPTKPQLIFTSRTHSQLIQFIEELHKTQFIDQVRCVSLASRKQLCINTSVNTKHASSTTVNDRCTDLQKNQSAAKPTTATTANGNTKRSKKPASSSTRGCPYLEPNSQVLYRDYTLTSVRDIEDLTKLGHKLSACAYYGTRKAISHSHIIVVPYQSLLHSTTRQQLGIDLTDAIVVIDEAHNLIESINSIHSMTLTLQTFSTVHSQLQQYYERYEKRLNDVNKSYIQQLIVFVNGCMKGITSKPQTSNGSVDTQGTQRVHTQITTSTAFMLDHMPSSLHAFNSYKLSHYITQSQLPKKLNGFIEKYIDNNEHDGDSAAMHYGTSSAISDSGNDSQKNSLYSINEFLTALNHQSVDGRVMITQSFTPTNQLHLQQSTLHYLSLNPSHPFVDIVKQARSTLLVGGTMSPFSMFTQTLLLSNTKRDGAVGDQQLIEDVRTLSVGHVVDSTQNVLCCTLATGPTNKTQRLTFTHSTQRDHATIDELGRIVVNFTRIIPDGVVLFFTSYSYERYVFDRWQSTGVVADIERKKRVFREPTPASDTTKQQSNGATAKTDSLLDDYTRYIRTEPSKRPLAAHTGALLSSVIGGKLSEGINFSDELARCVVMIGMPYPNAFDTELKEKMAYLDLTQQKPRANTSNSVSAGRQYYENLCWRAINQSIGRAIRHRNDHAAIVLIDGRYTKATQQPDTLPKWLLPAVTRTDTFGETFAAISQFFRVKKQTSAALQQ